MKNMCSRPQAAMSPSDTMRPAKPTHGGKRNGAGRKPATKARCVCGKHTLARAIRLRLKCRA